VVSIDLRGKGRCVGRLAAAGGCGSRVLRRMRAHHIDRRRVHGRGSVVAIARGAAGGGCGHPNPPAKGSSVPIGRPGFLGDNEATNARPPEAVFG